MELDLDIPELSLLRVRNVVASTSVTRYAADSIVTVHSGKVGIRPGCNKTILSHGFSALLLEILYIDPQRDTSESSFK